MEGEDLKHDFERLQLAMEMVGFLPATRKQYEKRIIPLHQHDEDIMLNLTWHSYETQLFFVNSRTQALPKRADGKRVYFFQCILFLAPM